MNMMCRHEEIFKNLWPLYEDNGRRGFQNIIAPDQKKFFRIFESVEVKVVYSAMFRRMGFIGVVVGVAWATNNQSIVSKV